MGLTVQEGLKVDLTKAHAAMVACNSVSVAGVPDPTQNPVGYQAYNTEVKDRLDA